MSTLHWPQGLDEAGFRARYWQRQPLLLPQALPGFESPISPDELAGLAIEPDTTPRLIRHTDAAGFTLEHGPFEASIFATLGARDWSLLVTDVDKHLPQLADWLMPFRIAPDWRLDDLMISYAPDGASVGAHVDAYDVFLLQASGTRRWSIDAREGVTHEQLADGDLRLVKDFTPTDSWDLQPGDVLYLPPGVPHHGIAIGEDCMTWSIGFRAPRHADIVQFIADAVAERLGEVRLTDAGSGRGSPGKIDAESIDAIETVWRAATTLDRATLAELAGRLLTRHAMADEVVDDSAGGDRIERAPFARFGWCDAPSADADTVTLFADGERYSCSAELARSLCSDGPLDLPASADDATQETLHALLDAGSLLARSAGT